jgi:hypothetical protein
MAQGWYYGRPVDAPGEPIRHARPTNARRTGTSDDWR